MPPPIASDPADGPNGTLMDNVTGLLGFSGWKIDTPLAVDIQTNRYRVNDGVFGGQGGIICESSVIVDRFHYRTSVVPSGGNSRFGLIFRASLESGPWQQDGDGFTLNLIAWAGSGDNATADVDVRRRVAGVSSSIFTVIAMPAPLISGFDMGVTVLGKNLDIWTEPYGGGARITHAAAIDLTTLANGSTDDFNDPLHSRFGIDRTSNGEINTVFENIEVETLVISLGEIQILASMQNASRLIPESDRFSPGVQFDGLNPRFYRGSSFQRRDN
jgi:hypothetical protein